MYITILGSGTNLHPSRAAAGYLVETDHAFLVDFGPGTLKNLTHTDIDRHSIDHLFFTHHHPDHLSDFIPFFFDAVNISKPLLVTPTVCSNCADKDLSLVTAVHPSFNNFVL